MLYVGTEDEPLGPHAARALLVSNPCVVRHTRAWVDDGELCLEVECLIAGGELITLRMMYCWDVPSFRGINYLADVAVWALEGDWASFRRFVQQRLAAALAARAAGDP